MNISNTLQSFDYRPIKIMYVFISLRAYTSTNFDTYLPQLLATFSSTDINKFIFYLLIIYLELNCTFSLSK